MNENLKRRENETDFEYGLRLIKMKCEKTLDLDWDEIIELTNIDCHRDSLRKACSVTQFSSYRVMQYYEDKINQMKIKSGNSEDIEELLEKLRVQTLEFEKEKIRFQDQKREYKNYLRADARFEHLKQQMTEEIKLVSEIKPFKNTECVNINGKTEIVALCSDWHIGLKEENYWNKVDVSIMYERIDKYTDKIIEISKRHNSNILHLELLGDLINGLIHLSTRVENEEDVIKQVMTCSEIISNMIHKLSGHFKTINVYTTTGNHGRVTANIKDSIDTEQFEKLIPWYLEARIGHLNNINIIKNKYDDDIIVYKFLNETIFAVHGHNDKINSVVNNLSQMLKIFPTEIHLGHFHHFYENEDYDIPVTVNGTASGTDKYAKRIRKTSKPMQVCMVYNNEGRECTYKIKL